MEWLREDPSDLFFAFPSCRRKATQVGEKPAKDESANVSYGLFLPYTPWAVPLGRDAGEAGVMGMGWV